MATYTTNFNLEKPAQNEAVDVDVLNSNSDIIDDNLGQVKQLALNIGYGYNNAVPYFVGDYCVYENKLYKCIQDIETPENFDISKWQQCNLANELQNIKGNPDGNITESLTKLQIGNNIYKIEEGANENIAETYDATSTYDVGDYVIYHDDLYKCTTAVSTAEPFDSTKWTECLVTDEMGSGIQMTILSYGTSTWNDFITAYQSNSIVYCRAASGSSPQSGSQNRLAFMAYVNDATSPTEVEFQYYRSVATHTASQQGDQVYVYKLNNTGTWSVTTREASTKIVAGTNMTSSYSNGVLTLNATGSGGSGGHTIIDNDGTALTQRDEMQFVGTYSEDDSTNEITKVNIVREMTKAEFDLLSDDEKTGIINVTDEAGIASVINGVFIDTDNVIQATTTYTTSGMSYTATEDCVVVIGLVNKSGDDANAYIDGKLVQGIYGGRESVQYHTIFLKKGQILTATTSYVETTGDLNYTVYGIQQGSQETTNNEIYSTDERAVGTWIDGSTIYQKTFELSNTVITNANSWSTISGVNLSGNEDWILQTIVYLNADKSAKVGFGKNDNGVFKYFDTIQLSIDKVTIQYTKTTT